MSTCRRVLSVVVALTISGAISPARAQSASPIARGDLSGTVGWLLVEKDFPGPYNSNDWHSGFFAAAGAGWYWTDHLKTELDFGAGTDSRTYRATPVTVNGRQQFATTESTFSRRTLGLSQQYQFFRNVWFHPHIAAGANITWETTLDDIHPVVIYEPMSPPRTVEPGRREGPTTDVTVRPFAAAGFKAYMTSRSFFRTDLRVGFRGGVDEIQLRLGFGIDF